ncbi:hypothetical protein [Citrobacter portucalensis]|uniref:hypothetical protein n=1 Tax=Citrobacter portucalensis TaxID=1639133 RepID=UPI00292BC635|nr:hypothetical protein [Citrobacter portucalensis]MDV0583410.1 hypothetical protein [Citrobacter portucalensis]MEB0660223.1 hypothetical protein [Citrobacter portucalensis]MEB0700200.1 hypothetical protein [Citrobacter portucalensis]
MKFTELPDHVIEAAAKTLSRELEGVSTWEDGKRTEKAKAVAESVRDSFIQLCSEEKNVTSSFNCQMRLGIKKWEGKDANLESILQNALAAHAQSSQ